MDQDESNVPLLRHVLTLSGTVVPYISGWLIYSVIVGFVALYATVLFDYETGLQPDSLSIAGTMLGFLLVFRINFAYSRFWEARGAVGAAVIASRDLASQVSIFIRGDGTESVSKRANIVRLIVLGFCAMIHEVRVDKSPVKWTQWCSNPKLCNAEISPEEEKKILAVPRPCILIPH